MRTYSVPRIYQRFLESSIALTLAEIGRDTRRREDEDPRVRALATIPDMFVDAAETGRLVVLVMTEAEAEALTVNSEPGTAPRLRRVR